MLLQCTQIKYKTFTITDIKIYNMMHAFVFSVFAAAAASFTSSITFSTKTKRF